MRVRSAYSRHNARTFWCSMCIYCCARLCGIVPECIEWCISASSHCSQLVWVLVLYSLFVHHNETVTSSLHCLTVSKAVIAELLLLNSLTEIYKRSHIKCSISKPRCTAYTVAVFQMTCLLVAKCVSDSDVTCVTDSSIVWPGDKNDDIVTSASICHQV
jgi:hypothetical protein